MTFRLMPIYRLGGWGAAASMVAICTLITLQVLFRLLDAVLVMAGSSRLGLEITGVSELASFLLVGATFLGMAYTFTHHAHIRMSLVIQRLPAAVRAFTELACLLIASALNALLCVSLWQLMQESLEYDDVSSGLLAIPLWIPQLVLLIGMVMMSLALTEALIDTARQALQAPQRFQAPDDEAGHD
ncbi:TRAP transporter small permease subunit [Halomonas denitrificans]|uniref:TRAP transporter small permease n=1 Tax=Halomonas denitrificans TaxID=370769 RepID=UPI001CD55818|nr:TRAP transporter small permease subunit [Halomonas denitrificans]MCA0974711.1 TRAP transporter small permease subunit [Halomonas denitrificans]